MEKVDRALEKAARRSGARGWRRPRRVASVDEVGRGNDNDAEGGWGLEQEA